MPVQAIPVQQVQMVQQVQAVQQFEQVPAAAVYAQPGFIGAGVIEGRRRPFIFRPR